MFDNIASVYFIEKYIRILALEMASSGNQHCANCIGTFSFPIDRYLVPAGHSAANLPAASASVDRWDIRTDGPSDGRQTVTQSQYSAHSV